MSIDLTIIELLINKSNCKVAKKKFQKLAKLKSKEIAWKLQLVKLHQTNKDNFEKQLLNLMSTNDKYNQEVLNFKSWMADEILLYINKHKIEGIHGYPETLIDLLLKEMPYIVRTFNLEAFCYMYSYVKNLKNDKKSVK